MFYVYFGNVFGFRNKIEFYRKDEGKYQGGLGATGKGINCVGNRPWVVCILWDIFVYSNSPFFFFSIFSQILNFRTPKLYENLNPIESKAMPSSLLRDIKNSEHSFDDEVENSDDDFGDNYDSDGEQSVYSDAEFDDFHNKTGDFDDHIFVQTEQDKIEYELALADAEKIKMIGRFQNFEKMSVILPARKMPSVMEMDLEFQTLLKAERKEKYSVLGSFLLPRWKKLVNAALIEWEKKQTTLLRMKVIALWKRYRRTAHNHPIKTLEPLAPLDEEYAMVKLCYRVQDAIINHFTTVALKCDRTKALLVAEKSFRAKEKARALKKQGLNRKTEWHQARKSQALACGPETEKERIDRLSRKAARKVAKSLAPVARVIEIEPKICFNPITIEDDVSPEQRETEKAELDTFLVLINRVCVEKAEAREVQEKVEEAEKVEKARIMAEEKAEEDRFVTILGRNTHKGKKILHFESKSLIAQKYEERSLTNQKYAKRTSAFEEMGDKDKLTKVLTRTALCLSVIKKCKCPHGDKCRFAHSVHELTDKECRFGKACGYVKIQTNGQYLNVSFGHNKNKKCSCMHPGEHKRGFCVRMGIKYVEPVEPAVKTLKLETKTEPIKYSPSILPPPKTQLSWAKTVTKAETKSIISEAKMKMEKKWADVVVSTLTEDEKTAMYGKGAEMVSKQMASNSGLGKTNIGRSTPVVVNPTTTRKAWDKRGLGFVAPRQPTTSKVLISGFNWVKGVVLEPTIQTPIQKTPVVSELMAKVYAEVEKINKRVVERTAAKINCLVFSVSRENAEAALMSAMNSGISSFSVKFAN